ncbi:hypothetical protein APHAL10511_000997 [Amanita phalloides]|nr:hypothetical protein APHAL10511_000997 [Amanita phalloides]
MSDSEDLGGFLPITPLPPPRRTTKPRKNANSEAGPSSKPSRAPKAAGASKKAANPRKKQPSTNDNDSDVQEVIQEDEVEQTGTGNTNGEDIEMVDVTNGKKGAAGSTTVAHSVNGKSAGKGKGKAKAPATKTKIISPEAAAIDVDAVERLEELEDEMDVAQETVRAVVAPRGGGIKDKNSREVAKLQERLRHSQEQVQLLIEKLEETHRIRDTEAEKLMKALDDQYQIELKSKEALLEGLSSQLAQKEPLTSGGNHSILHMITRETADEEQRKLLRENDQLRAQVKEKDKLIAGLRQTENELRIDLKAEIEHAKLLSDKSHRTPQMVPRSRIAGTAFEDPKNAEVIRFYEDLTNLLVTNMKHQASHRPGADDWILKCIYTYSEDDMSSDAMQKSVAFTLRTVFLGTESDPNEQSIHYTPDDLDKEPPDFVEKLGFLNQPFSFSRKQLSLFLRTLYDSIKAALASESDDEIQIVEK